MPSSMLFCRFPCSDSPDSNGRILKNRHVADYRIPGTPGFASRHYRYNSQKLNRQHLWMFDHVRETGNQRAREVLLQFENISYTTGFFTLCAMQASFFHLSFSGRLDSRHCRITPAMHYHPSTIFIVINKSTVVKNFFQRGKSDNLTLSYAPLLTLSGCGSSPIIVISPLLGPYTQNTLPADGVLFSR